MNHNDLNITEGFPLKDISLSDIATITGCEMAGQDLKIIFLVRMKSRKNDQQSHLTYVTSEAYLDQFIASKHEAAIIPEAMAHLIKGGKTKKSFLITSRDPETVFFELHETLNQKNIYSSLDSYIGENCDIHSSVVIHNNVVIKNNVKLHPNVVVFPNSYIDDNVEIKPGTIVGGQGIERKMLFGKPKLVSHTGGVYIGKNVFIGGNVSIDRGEMGDFTQIHDSAVIDNLVYVAHNVVVGPECFVVASSQISGSVIFGRGVWYSPTSCCKPEIRLGDYTYTGTGTVVMKDTKPFSLVYGNPGRHKGWMCKCQKHKLTFQDGKTTCKCGRSYTLENETVFLVKDI
jgi:UDP-3-O-[3-hydroxymyristoyl] glucosamine N-acyltransferase